MFKHERLNIKAAFYWDYAADNGHYVNFIESIYMMAGNNDETHATSSMQMPNFQIITLTTKVLK